MLNLQELREGQEDLQNTLTKNLFNNHSQKEDIHTMMLIPQVFHIKAQSKRSLVITPLQHNQIIIDEFIIVRINS